MHIPQPRHLFQQCQGECKRHSPPQPAGSEQQPLKPLAPWRSPQPQHHQWTHQQFEQQPQHHPQGKHLHHDAGMH